MKEIQIDAGNASQRFDKFLKRILPEATPSFIYKMLRKKNITLNNSKADGKEILNNGDIVKIFFADETFDKFSGKHGLTQNRDSMNEYVQAYQSIKNISIIYEDDDVLLINKPSGILSQKAKDNDVSLNEWFIGYLFNSGCITEESFQHFKPSVLNRLDRNTSGIILCGKTLIGSRVISQMLKDRTLEKYYITYVEGCLVGENTLIAFHKKDTKNNQAEIIIAENEAVAVPEGYKKIITKYKLLSHSDNISKLEIELITGKTHQIRAHLSAIGYPIVGDKKYGSKIYRKDGQLLHCYRIVFPRIEGELSRLSEKEFICEG